MKALSVFFATVACLLLAFPTDGATMVGIIVENAGAAEVGDLLTTSLSKLPNTSVLERAELNRILAEQTLAQKRPEDQLKAARLLGANGLLFLGTEQSGTNTFLLARIVATGSGAVLSAERLPYPREKIEEWAAGLAKKLSVAIAKTAIPIDKAVRFSLLNLRSANSTAEAQQLDRDLIRLLLRRLANEPTVFVLERTAMSALQMEKEFAQSTESFWTGSHLLDGVVNKSGIDPTLVTVDLNLVSRSLTNFIHGVGPRTNLASVVDELAKAVLAKAEMVSSGAWNPAKEAAEYLAEAEWSLRWQMIPEAQAAAESAWALGAQTIPVAVAVVRSLAKQAEPIYDSNLNHPDPGAERIEIALRALDFAQRFLTRQPDAVLTTNGMPRSAIQSG